MNKLMTLCGTLQERQLPTYASSNDATNGVNGISFNYPNYYQIVGKGAYASVSINQWNGDSQNLIFTFDRPSILYAYDFISFSIPSQLPRTNVTNILGSADGTSYITLCTGTSTPDRTDGTTSFWDKKAVSNNFVFKKVKVQLAIQDPGNYGSVGVRKINLYVRSF